MFEYDLCCEVCEWWGLQWGGSGVTPRWTSHWDRLCCVDDVVDSVTTILRESVWHQQHWLCWLAMTQLSFTLTHILLTWDNVRQWWHSIMWLSVLLHLACLHHDCSHSLVIHRYFRPGHLLHLTISHNFTSSCFCRLYEINSFILTEATAERVTNYGWWEGQRCPGCRI